MKNTEHHITQALMLALASLILYAHAGVFTPEQSMHLAEAFGIAAAGFPVLVIMNGLKEYLK